MNCDQVQLTPFMTFPSWKHTDLAIYMTLHAVSLLSIIGATSCMSAHSLCAVTIKNQHIKNPRFTGAHAKQYNETTRKTCSHWNLWVFLHVKREKCETDKHDLRHMTWCVLLWTIDKIVHANTLIDDLQALLDQDSKITLEVFAFSVLYYK